MNRKLKWSDNKRGEWKVIILRKSIFNHFRQLKLQFFFNIKPTLSKVIYITITVFPDSNLTESREVNVFDYMINSINFISTLIILFILSIYFLFLYFHFFLVAQSSLSYAIFNFILKFQHFDCIDTLKKRTPNKMNVMLASVSNLIWNGTTYKHGKNELIIIVYLLMELKYSASKEKNVLTVIIFY